jgi:hypothetical protein
LRDLLAVAHSDVGTNLPGRRGHLVPSHWDVNGCCVYKLFQNPT